MKKKKLAERKSIDAPKDYERKRKHTFREHAQREKKLAQQTLSYRAHG